MLCRYLIFTHTCNHIYGLTNVIYECRFAKGDKGKNVEPLQLFKLLSDQTRLDIVLLLKASGELCVCDIYTALDLSQPKTSRHLAMLREAGVLLDSKHGRWVHYRLSPALMPWVKSVIGIAHATEEERIHQLLKTIGTKEPIESCTV